MITIDFVTILRLLVYETIRRVAFKLHLRTPATGNRHHRRQSPDELLPGKAIEHGISSVGAIWFIMLLHGRQSSFPAVQRWTCNTLTKRLTS